MYLFSLFKTLVKRSFLSSLSGLDLDSDKLCVRSNPVEDAFFLENSDLGIFRKNLERIMEVFLMKVVYVQ